MWFALFFLLSFMLAIGATLLYRYFTTKTISEVFFPLRMPFWGSILSWVLMVAGLIGAAVEISLYRRPFRQTWGWWLFLGSLASFLGGWLGGVLSSFGLQLFTAWPVAPPPPQNEKKP